MTESLLHYVKEAATTKPDFGNDKDVEFYLNKWTKGDILPFAGLFVVVLIISLTENLIFTLFGLATLLIFWRTAKIYKDAYLEENYDVQIVKKTPDGGEGL